MDIEKFSPQETEPKIKLSTRILPTRDDRFDRDLSYNQPTMQSNEERQRFQKVTEAVREVGKTRERFWNMLVTEVAETQYQPPQDRQTQILDVGCGKCEEGIVLSAYFGGGEFGSASNNAKLIGIDIKKEDIDRAISNHQLPDFSERIIKYVLPSNFEFIHGDATNLDQYPQIPGQVDVIVIRHQQISDNEQVWLKIFQEALNRLSPNGIMILTSFSNIEHKMLMEKLNALDVEILVDKANSYAKPTQHKEVSIDRNITIVKRKNKNG